MPLPEEGVPGRGLPAPRRIAPPGADPAPSRRAARAAPATGGPSSRSSCAPTTGPRAFERRCGRCSTRPTAPTRSSWSTTRPRRTSRAGSSRRWPTRASATCSSPGPACRARATSGRAPRGARSSRTPTTTSRSIATGSRWIADRLRPGAARRRRHRAGSGRRPRDPLPGHLRREDRLGRAPGAPALRPRRERPGHAVLPLQRGGLRHRGELRVPRRDPARARLLRRAARPRQRDARRRGPRHLPAGAAGRVDPLLRARGGRLALPPRGRARAGRTSSGRTGAASAPTPPSTSPRGHAPRDRPAGPGGALASRDRAPLVGRRPDRPAEAPPVGAARRAARRRRIHPGPSGPAGRRGHPSGRSVTGAPPRARRGRARAGRRSGAAARRPPGRGWSPPRR